MGFSKTVEKTLRILELISASPDGITLSQITKALDLPKATVYDILQTLYKEDAIYYKDQNLKTYVIGSKIFAISQAYTKNSHLINFSKDKLKEYADKYGMTCFAVKKIENQVVLISKYESKNAKITTPDIGSREKIYSSSAGKVFIAYMKKEKQEALYSQLESTLSSSDFDELKMEVNEIAEVGYHVDNGNYRSYMCTYSVPVYNFENKVVGVLNASRVIQNETNEEIKKQVADLIEIASYVSCKQGYKGDIYEKIKL